MRAHFNYTAQNTHKSQIRCTDVSSFKLAASEVWLINQKISIALSGSSFRRYDSKLRIPVRSWPTLTRAVFYQTNERIWKDQIEGIKAIEKLINEGDTKTFWAGNR